MTKTKVCVQNYKKCLGLLVFNSTKGVFRLDVFIVNTA